MLGFFRCVAEAIAHKGIAGLVADSGIPGAQYIVDVAGDAYKRWKQKSSQQELRAEVEQMAVATFEQAREAAKDVAREVAAGNRDLELGLELYLTQIPAAVRQSLKRPDDLSGTTIPDDFCIEDEDDVAKLLPPRMPRFKPGDAPAFLKGWVLEEQIGAGGFGEVWRGRNKRTPSLVGAIKFGHSLSDRDFSLLNENDVVNRVMEHGEHPGIVALRDVWADGDDLPWLRFEFIAGGDLTGLIHAWQKLPPEQRLAKAVAALRELAETVGHFHSLNPAIVHRDLKPSNILVANGKLKVADFGIGAVSARRLLAGEVAGSISQGARLQSYLRGSHTPLYAPPEQRDPKHKPHPQDDLHALGVIGFQMITGHLHRGVDAFFEEELLDFGATSELAKLLKQCVATNPTRRPKDANELAKLLVVGEPAPTEPTAKAPILLPESVAPTPENLADSTSRNCPTLVVAQDGTGQFKQLKEAVAAAKPGARILVRPGVYTGDIVIDKPLDIDGGGLVGQIIIESKGKPGFTFCGSRASVKGLKIAELGGHRGVVVQRGQVTLAECQITSGWECVFVEPSAQLTLSGCRVTSRERSGCHVGAGSQLTAEKCTISGSAWSGIYVDRGGELFLRSSFVNRNGEYGVILSPQAAATITDSDLTQNNKESILKNSTKNDIAFHSAGNKGMSVY